jgi:hypothetical protein
MTRKQIDATCLNCRRLDKERRRLEEQVKAWEWWMVYHQRYQVVCHGSTVLVSDNEAPSTRMWRAKTATEALLAAYKEQNK